MAIVTARQLVERNPAMSIGGVRNDCFNRDLNGLTASGALIFRGRRMLIDEDLYFAWMRNRSRERIKVEAPLRMAKLKEKRAQLAAEEVAGTPQVKRKPGRPRKEKSEPAAA
jgi:hypothetical protein